MRTRRSVNDRMKLRPRTILYLILAVGMLLYAIPRLHVGNGWTEETIFAASWIAISLLIIAAHLYDWIGVDEKTQKELDAVKRYKYWRLQQKMTNRLERGHERSK